MKKRMKLLLLLVMLAVGVAGCGNKEEKETPSVQYENTEYDGLFDIEAARKDIIIQGQPFEIPVALKDLPEGWTYEARLEDSELYDEGNGIIYLLYNGEKMSGASVENYYPDRIEDSIVYNLTVRTDKCMIAGVIPTVSTKQEVVDMYGDPVMVSKAGGYYYGIYNDTSSFGGRLNSQCICVSFEEDDVVKSVSIAYADLTK